MRKLRRGAWVSALSLMACAGGDDGSGTNLATGGRSAAGGMAGTTSTAGGGASAGTVNGGLAGGGAGLGGSASTNAGSGGSVAAGAAGSSGAGNGGAGAGNGGASAGNGGAVATCATAGTELCEDFESGQIDAKRWQLNKNPGSASITVDAEHVHGGKFAAHLKIEAGKQSSAMLSEALTFPAQANSFYARAYFYFTPELPTAPGGDYHMGFILGLGKNDAGDVQAGMGMIGGEKQYLGYSIFFGPPKYEFGPWSKAKVEPNKWACIELFEDGSSPTEEKRQVWLDGTELTDLRSTSANNGAPANHKPPAFDHAAFGVWEYHPSPLLSDIWLDDIRVSAKPIGCN